MTQVRTFRRVSWRRKSPKPAAKRSTSAQLWGTPPQELGLPDPPRLRCVAAKISRSKTRLKEQPCLTVFRPQTWSYSASYPKENVCDQLLWSLVLPLTCRMICHTQLYRTSQKKARLQTELLTFKISALKWSTFELLQGIVKLIQYPGSINPQFCSIWRLDSCLTWARESYSMNRTNLL